MYQLAQAARHLKMSRQWLYELIDRGDLTTAQVGGVRFVLDDDRFKAIKRRRAKESGK